MAPGLIRISPSIHQILLLLSTHEAIRRRAAGHPLFTVKRGAMRVQRRCFDGIRAVLRHPESHWYTSTIRGVRVPAGLFDSIEEKRGLVDRVADSALFLKSPRLREFLLYVAECTLNDRPDGAREQSIAEHVFNRKPDYATQDSIVRAEARNLRKRLESYFATNGRDEATIIEMPRGQYLLTFRPREVDPGLEMLVVPATDPLSGLEATASSAVAFAAPGMVTAPAPSQEPVAHVYRRLCAVLAVVAVVATVMAIRFYAAGMEFRQQIPPVAHSLPLSAIFGNSLDTLIVTSDTTLVPFFSSARHRVSLNDYITRSYPAINQSFPADLARKGEYTDGQEMAIAGELLQANARAVKHVFLRTGHQVQLSDLKDHNLILLGSSYSNPWGQMFEEKLSFRLELGGGRDPGLAGSVPHQAGQSAYPCDADIVVRNLSPRAGEPAVYPCYSNNHSYAVVSFIPGENSTGDVLWIAGTTAESTAAAGEFVVDEKQTRRALKNAGIDPEGPPHFFELLLKVTSFVGGSTQAEVIAARVSPAHKP